jgi:hypothetical protein
LKQNPAFLVFFAATEGGAWTCSRSRLTREVPETMKPRRIAIVGTGNENQKTENTQAA